MFLFCTALFVCVMTKQILPSLSPSAPFLHSRFDPLSPGRGMPSVVPAEGCCPWFACVCPGCFLAVVSLGVVHLSVAGKHRGSWVAELLG